MTPPDLSLETSLVVFQACVTLGIAGLFLALAVTYRKRYFGIWGGAWSVYALRLAIIALYLVTTNRIWPLMTFLTNTPEKMDSRR